MTEIIKLQNVCLKMPDINRVRSIRQFLAKPWDRNNNSETCKVQNNILNHINLNIASGERVGLIGANGAGKSTFLRLLAGIYTPTEGLISIEGEVSALLDLNVGFDLEATGFENIPIAAAQLGYQPQQKDELIDFVIEFTELGKSLHLPIRSMSNGMQMRLAFAITIFSTANILLIDEIIGVGDSKFIKKATSYLRESSLNKTLVLASHAEFMIHDFCTKAAVFDSGKIVFFGDISEGFNIYKSLH